MRDGRTVFCVFALIHIVDNSDFEEETDRYRSADNALRYLFKIKAFQIYLLQRFLQKVPHNCCYLGSRGIALGFKQAAAHTVDNPFLVGPGQGGFSIC